MTYSAAREHMATELELWGMGKNLLSQHLFVQSQQWIPE